MGGVPLHGRGRVTFKGNDMKNDDRIHVDASQGPAILRYGGRAATFPTLATAKMALDGLPTQRRTGATIRVAGREYRSPRWRDFTTDDRSGPAPDSAPLVTATRDGSSATLRPRITDSTP